MRKKKRNFWPALILTLLWWLLLLALVVGVDPAVVADFPLPGSYLVFFGLLFLAVWFLCALLLANSRRGLLIALAVVILGYLRLWQLLTWLTTVLTLGVFLSFEIYGRD